MDNGGKDFYLAPKPRINLVQCLKSLKPKVSQDFFFNKEGTT